MFGFLNTTQIYGLQHEQHANATTTTTAAATAAAAATTKTTSTTLTTNLTKQQQKQQQRGGSGAGGGGGGGGGGGDSRSGFSSSSSSSNNNNSNKQHRRSTSNVTETLKEKRFFATLSSSMPQSIKSPTNFIEKFLRSELLGSYDTLKNYKNTQNNNNSNSSNSNTNQQQHHYNNNIQATNSGRIGGSGGGVGIGVDGIYMHLEQREGLNSFNCLHGSYRSNCDGEFYEAINLNTKPTTTTATTPSATTTTTTGIRNNYSNSNNNNNKSEMTIKCSKNLLVESTQPQSPATLQNYQKLPDFAHDLMIDVHSGASSGEFNHQQQQQQQQQQQHHHQQHQQQHHHHHHQSSGSETNNGLSSAASNLYKKLSFGSRNSKQQLDINGSGSGSSNTTQTQSNEVASDNSSSSISTTTTHTTSTSNASTPRASHNCHNSSNNKAIARTSSSSSSADCASKAAVKAGVLKGKERRKAAHEVNENSGGGGGGGDGTLVNVTPTLTLTPERAQRRRLMQMISNYDQQNKQLQRELAKEKRRRTEELACVVKSLLCFESKLKTDMKAVNQRMLEKDNEICRLVRQNRALRKRLAQQQYAERESARDEGVVEDGGEEQEHEQSSLLEVRDSSATECGEKLSDTELLAIDCLVLEALQCMNCRKQFYDIDLKECWTQTKDCTGVGIGAGGTIGGRKKDEHTTEPCCSSSDDTTVSSSFYGARRSVRYTSKRTAGTFRDYMRSRAMNIDDPALEQNSEENTSTISREDESQTTSSYEKINMYSRTIERMHGVKCDDSERERLQKRRTPQIEEDDGIFSPTQDDEEDEDEEEEEDDDDDNVNAKQMCNDGSIKIVLRRSIEFSEAAPKQLYETSTDDWYASASDQEDLVLARAAASNKPYGHGAVNPVLECVNQILLQESMDEAMHELPPPPPPSALQQHKHQHQQQLTPKTSAHLLQVPTAASAASHLPRRSSLSDRRTERNNSNNQGNETSNARTGTLTRKRVHFSTKNSMVHVPRHDTEDDDDDDEDDDDDDDDDANDGNGNENANDNGGDANLISSHSSLYYPMNYCPPSPQQMAERERMDVLNYESIYSNEYEPIGSEHNSSNLYVDMEAATKLSAGVSTAAMATPNGGHGLAAAAATGANSGSSNSSTGDSRMTKMPPALPPKPANLLKFRKSLQQLDEVPETADCGQSLSGGGSEPDYCSISEVNVGMTSVQIVADVHKAPTADEEETEAEALVLEALEVSTVASSGDEEAVLQKTDKRNVHNQPEKPNSHNDGAQKNEMEEDEDEVELLADIPKLPNVAAIIVPKSPKKPPQQQQQHQKLKQQQTHSDYLTMTPKVPPPNLKLLTPLITPIKKTTKASNNSTPSTTKTLKTTTPAVKPFDNNSPLLKLHLNVTPGNCGGGGGGSGIQQPYKRKHMPNILAEINKRMSQPNSPTTPTKPTTPTSATTTMITTPTTAAAAATTAQTPTTTPSNGSLCNKPGSALLKELEQTATATPSLPLEAEFDWYNLDAEYGKVPAASSSGGSVGGGGVGVGMGMGIGIGVGGTKMLAEIHEDHESIDEYNLDEEFSLASSEKEDSQHHSEEEPAQKDKMLPAATATALEKQQRNAVLNAIGFPIYCEGSPLVVPTIQPHSLIPTVSPLQTTKAKKMKKNLANFEKFIEGSGLSTKPLPSRRKIYFAGPV